MKPAKKLCEFGILLLSSDWLQLWLLHERCLRAMKRRKQTNFPSSAFIAIEVSSLVELNDWKHSCELRSCLEHVLLKIVSDNYPSALLYGHHYCKWTQLLEPLLFLWQLSLVKDELLFLVGYEGTSLGSALLPEAHTWAPTLRWFLVWYLESETFSTFSSLCNL